MSTKTKFIIITLVFAIPAFLLGRQIWPPSPDMVVPTSSQLFLLIILSVLESVAFGLGVAFLILGWPLLKKVSGKGDALTKLTFLSIAWFLINWWPHDNLHVHNGINLNGLLKIDYGFHITLVIAGAILAYFFFTRVLKPGAR